MSILDRASDLGDIPTEVGAVARHCSYCLSPLDAGTGPLVFWKAADTDGAEVRLVLHPKCAHGWAGHLTADATEARVLVGLRRRLGERP